MAHRCPTRPRSAALTGERGDTLIEVIVAALIIAIGLTAAIVSFVAPGKLIQASQHQTQAASIAEADLENMVGRQYPNIALTTVPSHAADSLPGNPSYVPDSTNPSNPLYLVNDPVFYGGGCSGTTLAVLNVHSRNTTAGGQLPEAPSCGETLVPASSGGVASSVATTSIFPSAPAGTVYRFVTWRNEKCVAPTLAGGLQTQLQQLVNGLLAGVDAGDSGAAATLNGIVTLLFGGSGSGTPTGQFCSSPNNEKRVTVAVELNQSGSTPGFYKPVYVSAIVPDPLAGAPKPPSCNLSILFLCF